MILYSSDWSRYPNAVADTTTKNTSFVRLAKVYRDMGIKNHMFLLALHNPALQGIDPHTPNLPLDIQIAIALECKINFWYYLREVARIPVAGLETGELVAANRGNIALYWLFWNHITTLQIQIRQTGKTVGFTLLSSYLTNVKCRKTTISVLTKNDELRSKTVMKLRDFDSVLPGYIKQRSPKKDSTNTEYYTVNTLENRVDFAVSSSSPKLAMKVFRGNTSAINICDEAAYVENVKVALGSMLPAADKARMWAEKNNEPYGTIIATTAGDIGDRDGGFIYSLVTESAMFNEAFYDATDRDTLETTVRSASPSGASRVRIDFNHKQLGYTDEWLRRNVEESTQTGDDARRDYGNEWTYGSQAHPLERELQDVIKKSENLQYYSEVSENSNFIIRWHIPKGQIESTMAGGMHVIAIDPSEGIGKDDLSLQIMSVRTGAVVASANIHTEVLLVTFAQWFAGLLVRFPKTVAVIERRSSGQTLIDTLLLILPSKQIDPFKRVFNWVVDGYIDDPRSPSDTKQLLQSSVSSRGMYVYEQNKKHFGFATSGAGVTSRKDLYGSLSVGVSMMGDTIRDPITVKQMLELVNRNGRIDHPPGGNDDLVFAWLLGFWFLTKAKNLSHYGIEKGTVLSEVKYKTLAGETKDTYRDQKEAENRRRLMDEAEYITGQIRDERDQSVVAMLERQLMMTYKRMGGVAGNVSSVEELIHTLREEKRTNKTMRRLESGKPHTPHGGMRTIRQSEYFGNY